MYKIKSLKELLESKANKLGISFEEILELIDDEKRFSYFTEQVIKKTKRKNQNLDTTLLKDIPMGDDFFKICEKHFYVTPNQDMIEQYKNICFQLLNDIFKEVNGHYPYKFINSHSYEMFNTNRQLKDRKVLEAIKWCDYKNHTYLEVDDDIIHFLKNTIKSFKPVVDGIAQQEVNFSFNWFDREPTIENYFSVLLDYTISKLTNNNWQPRFFDLGLLTYTGAINPKQDLSKKCNYYLSDVYIYNQTLSDFYLSYENTSLYDMSIKSLDDLNKISIEYIKFIENVLTTHNEYLRSENITHDQCINIFNLLQNSKSLTNTDYWEEAREYARNKGGFNHEYGHPGYRPEFYGNNVSAELQGEYKYLDTLSSLYILEFYSKSKKYLEAFIDKHKNLPRYSELSALNNPKKFRSKTIRKYSESKYEYLKSYFNVIMEDINKLNLNLPA